jgi:16S rRNA (guanine527-N7)-methyltransferase|tara:strand:+ start:2832 stop:3470 length:639 start_codon:yes stop_codon:yes gene_type:complete
VFPERQSLATRLAEGAAQAGLSLDDGAVDACLDFLELLFKWNRVHNLTGPITTADAVSRHLLDSLVIAPLLRGERALDIGSGAGFPGLPLAIAQPTVDWTLLDSRVKRVGFLRQACARLKLPRVRIEHCRVENYRPNRNFDTLVTRAVAALPTLVGMTEHLRDDGVRLIVMKGTFPEAELKEVSAELRARMEVVRLNVPGLDAERHAVILDN